MQKWAFMITWFILAKDFINSSGKDIYRLLNIRKAS